MPKQTLTTDCSAPQAWETIASHGPQIADLIDGSIAEQPQAVRLRAAEVAKFLRDDASFQIAAIRPDVIAFASTFLSHSPSPQPSVSLLAAAVRRGLGSLSSQPTTLQRFIRRLLYPILIAVVGAGLLLGFAVYIAPEFERMFDEFGLQPPAVTQAMFVVTQFLRHWWPMLAVGAGMLAVTAFVVRGTITRRLLRITGVYVLSNRRRVLADLAVHTSHLRRLGVSAEDSLSKASVAAGMTLIPQSQQAVTLDESPFPVQVAEMKATSRQHSLLNYSVQLPQTPAHDAMLGEVADYYRRRTSTVSDWWIHWLVAAIQYTILVLILFAIASLFIPLISIISGLTGGF